MKHTDRKDEAVTTPRSAVNAYRKAAREESPAQKSKKEDGDTPTAPKPDTHKPAAHKPAAHKHDTHKADTHKHDAHKPDAPKPTEASGADNSAVLEQRITDLEYALAQAQVKMSELENEALRARADAENYRKRIEREKAAAIEFANSRILLDVVEVLDNFERALSSVEKTQANAALFDGVSLIKKEWIGMLGSKWGVREIEALRQAFDPRLHEAVAIEEDENATQEYVGEEFQKGYWLHSRVLRTARVKVVKPSAPQG